MVGFEYGVYARFYRGEHSNPAMSRDLAKTTHPRRERMAPSCSVCFGKSLAFSLSTLNHPLSTPPFSSFCRETVVGYGYDTTSGRLQNVSMGGRTATYGYVPNSDLIQTVSYNTSAAATVGTRTYQPSGALHSIAWAGGSAAQPLPSHTYSFDAAGRRQTADREDGSPWQYTYNKKGEVTSGKRTKPNNSATAKTGWSFGYDYDQFGNRKTYTAPDGVSYSAVIDSATGRLTQPANPPSRYVLARANPSATVTVKQNNSATSLTIVRDAGASDFSALVTRVTGWEKLVIAATDSNGHTTTRNGSLYLPPSGNPGETLVYDDDGNLTSDWRWTYKWDRKNQLTMMTTNADAVKAGAPNLRLEYSYDGFGRRIRKVTTTLNQAGTSILSIDERRYVYDGWNLIAEVAVLPKGNPVALQPLRAYAWGTDVSGSEQGAGGVGGLLFVQQYPGSTQSSVSFPTYDGNGNVMAYLDAANGKVLARYEYDPFGRILVAEEPVRYVSNGTATPVAVSAPVSPFRFSTKYTDDETGLCYYGYRYYSPDLGRWLSRDPIGEDGGANLYGFISNDTSNFIDYLGLLWKGPLPPKPQPRAPSAPGLPHPSPPDTRPITGDPPMPDPAALQIPSHKENDFDPFADINDRIAKEGGTGYDATDPESVMTAAQKTLPSTTAKIVEQMKQGKCPCGLTEIESLDVNAAGQAQGTFGRYNLSDRKFGTAPSSDPPGWDDAIRQGSEVNRGHLWARQWGGRGVQGNIVLMDKQFNQTGAWRVGFEQTRVSQMLNTDPHRTICFAVIPIYRYQPGSTKLRTAPKRFSVLLIGTGGGKYSPPPFTQPNIWGLSPWWPSRILN